jgi:fatty-acyl-CoA synthase
VLTIHSALQWWAKSRPDTPALVLGADRLSYGDLVPWVERTAARLIELGVQTGDRINACAANSIEYCVLALAAMRAGAIMAPLNTRFTAHELGEIVSDHAPRLIFAEGAQAEKFAQTGVPCHDLAEVTALRSGPKATVARGISPDNCVVIISTSGSTAKPKGVMFTNRSMCDYAMAAAMEDGVLRDGGGVIVVAPLATSAGMVQLVHYAVLGCTLYFEPLFVAERFLEILTHEPIVNFAGAPAFFERIAACPGFAEADLSHIKLVTAGGARVTHKLFAAWAAKGLFIRQTYGQTEAGGNSTVMPARFASEFPEKVGWGGMFTHHRIVDPQGNDVAPGIEGEILIRGPGMMQGYWNNPAATAEAIRDGWLHSGDIGVMDERGLITFIDRIKDIVVSGGLNISAAEVERAVLEFPGIEEAAVIAAHDDKFQETPLVAVYASAPIDVAALIAHCNQRLADFKVPRYVALRREPLPRLATGKISKPALRDEYRDAHLNLPRVR